MFGSIGLQELILIFIVALLLFGPRKITLISRKIGETIREFKRASNEIKETIEKELEEGEKKETYKNDNGRAG